MRLISYILLLFIILVGISFSVLNSRQVDVNYYVGQSTIPLSLLIIMVFVIGGLIGMFIGLWLWFKVKIKNRCIRRQLKLAEKEIENLRAIPLHDKH